MRFHVICPVFRRFAIALVFSLPLALFAGTPFPFRVNPEDSLKRSVCADSLLRYSFTLLGTRYQRGGTSSQGFDCSGFACHVYAKAGVDLPRTSRDQGRIGEEIDLSDVVPGDLLFFRGSRSESIGHVAIVSRVEGDSVWMIHASSVRKRVVEDRLQDLGYYTSRFVGARRVLPHCADTPE